MFPLMFEGGNTLPSISETSAQKLAAVFICLNVLGETRGSLPFDVKKNTKEGAVTEYSHPVHRLIHDRPNPFMTAFDFWSTTEKLKKAWGNAYAEIRRDAEGFPSSLWILPSCDVYINNYQSATGTEYYYTYKGRNLRHTDILHFKNYTMDGYCGISSIRQNALTIGLGLKLNQYNSSIIGDRPPGYLTSEKAPKDLQQKQNVRDMWSKRNSDQDENLKGATSYNGIPYLYGGLEFKAFTLPADDVAYLGSAKLTSSDIYGIFRVPPTFAQDWEKAPYNSSEQQDIVFAKYSLASIRGDEQECNEKLFTQANKITGDFYCKVNLRGLLRGDTNTRKEYYQSGIQNGYITPNQACELEEFPTYKGGDQHFIQLNMIPVDKIAEYIQGQISKGQPTQTREAIIKELRERIQPKMNGHWQQIDELLQ